MTILTHRAIPPLPKFCGILGRGLLAHELKKRGDIMNIKIHDMPKLESPFVRKMVNGDYIVTPEIAAGYEWVFESDKVLATEKLHGTNVSIVIEHGIVTQLYNRTERIPFINKSKSWLTEGVLESCRRGYIEFMGDGQFFGELIGERVNGNPLKVKGHLWIPFSTYAQNHLAYKSWGKYAKTFAVISDWFENDLFSLFVRRTTGEVVPPEGVVFVNTDTGQMAKLRRDMYSWFKGARHKEQESYRSQ